MKRTVRFITTVLVLLTLLLSLIPQAGLAAPKADNPGKGPKIKIKFKDIEKNWAKDYIEQLTAAGIFQGVKEDLFAPDDSVESVQVLVMVVRALGLEEKAIQYQQDKETVQNMSHVPAWARGYVRVALEEGLITEPELSNLRPGQKATRLDVAKYIGRLFEGDDWLGEGTLPDLSDLNDLPDDLKGYVILVAQKGIMIGTPDGQWLPYDLVNRGQMAKILSLVLSRLATGAQQTELYGEVVRVQLGKSKEDSRLTIKTKQDTYTYTISDECIIYVDGKQADLKDLEAGQRVRLVVTQKNGLLEAVYIRAENQAEKELTVEGTISALTLGQGSAITVNTKNGSETTFLVTDKTVIILDGREVFLSDLKLGQEVTVVGAEEDETIWALEIAAESDQKEISGKITAIVTRQKPSLSLEDNQGQSYTFRVTARTKIRLNGKTTVLEELQPKDQVRVWALDDEALQIEAKREEPKEEEVEGKITALVLGKNPAISIRTATGHQYTYNVTNDTRLWLDDKVSTLDALKVGWEVELKVVGDKAVTVWGESLDDDSERTVEGKLVQIKMGNPITVSIEDEDGFLCEYQVDKKVNCFFGEQKTTLDELKVGLEVKLTVQGGIVYQIEAED
ncbi:MAG: S-layer homology domain-containing protein [Firmicutes bacterium]|nr:S-layer homology domain-containing protein [Bacillota bacterium]